MISPYAYAGIPQNKKVMITEDMIIQSVCNYFRISRDRILLRSRRRELVTARQMACLLMMQLIPKITLNRIGYNFSQDHTTVIHSVNTIRNIIDTEDDIKEAYQNIKRILTDKNKTA